MKSILWKYMFFLVAILLLTFALILNTFIQYSTYKDIFVEYLLVHVVYGLIYYVSKIQLYFVCWNNRIDIVFMWMQVVFFVIIVLSGVITEIYMIYSLIFQFDTKPDNQGCLWLIGAPLAMIIAGLKSIKDNMKKISDYNKKKLVNK